MVNKILFKNHVIFKDLSDSKFSNIDNKKDNILLLDKPKLIYDIGQDNNKPIKEKIVKDLVFSNIDQESLITFVNKGDKKNKGNAHLNSDLNKDIVKKTKIKSKKRLRNQSNLNRDAMFIANKEFAAGRVNTEDSDTSLLELEKPKKNRKKYKIKKDSSSNIIPANHKYNLDKNNEDTDKKIIINSPLTIQELSNQLCISEAAIITWLFLKGISVTINQVVDIAIATEVAKHYGFTVVQNSQENPSNIKNSLEAQEINIDSDFISGIRRAPIVTIFGHVDHGKTTLLDSILKTNLVQLEVGGITQSINAHEVELEYLSSVEKLIFLDTPGHEAFSRMRLRGAEVTDLAVLVVAADDGLKPQSIEAINHILTRNIPYIIAINKIDKDSANAENVRHQLAEHNIISYEWGGNSEIIEISALTSLNIDLLLSLLCKLSKQQNLSVNPQSYASGTILETYIAIKTGVVANLVVQNGTLSIGDIILAGNLYGRVKSIVNSSGMKLKEAGPSSVINILGFSSTPEAGVKFQVVSHEKCAKALINQNTKKFNNVSNLLNTRVTLESYNNKSSLKVINIILKADTQGSIEAIINALFQLPQEKVQINILTTQCGSISLKDIELAMASNAIILGFNININHSLRNIAKKEGIQIKLFNIIYRLLDDIKQYMLNLIDIEYNQVLIGKATVQTVFNINKGTVAGCIVNSGKLIKNGYIKVYSKKELVYSGLIDSLKRIKDDVEEVIEGHECGLMCSDYHAWNRLDAIEVYEMVEKVKVL
uniref:Translation initiation factor IF-2, chloroplastic n=1 Tax=Betaphycus gelatinus TaxID=1191690 RepID=A0A8E7PGY9_9FLOR|nr:translation initiation factor 2 [Betaphycus gelatinus]